MGNKFEKHGEDLINFHMAAKSKPVYKMLAKPKYGQVAVKGKNGDMCTMTIIDISKLKSERE